MLKERIIWLLLITTGMVWGIKKILPEPENKEVEAKLFWIQKTFAPADYDLVLIGDSRTYRGLDPATIQTYSNHLRVLNFGYSSAGLTPGFIQQGVDKLKPDGKRIILFCVTPYSFTPKACLNEHFKQESKRKREEILEAIYFGSIKKYFAPLNLHDFLRRLKVEKNHQDSSFYHQEYHENGWVASWMLKHEFQKTVDSYKKEFSNNLPSLKAQSQFLKKVWDLKSQGYTIYVTRLPIQEDLFKLEEEVSRKFMLDLEKELVKMGVKWIGFPPTSHQTYDGSHLTKQGAINCSRTIGLILLNR